MFFFFFIRGQIGGPQNLAALGGRSPSSPTAESSPDRYFQLLKVYTYSSYSDSVWYKYEIKFQIINRFSEIRIWWS